MHFAFSLLHQSVFIGYLIKIIAFLLTVLVLFLYIYNFGATVFFFFIYSFITFFIKLIISSLGIGVQQYPSQFSPRYFRVKSFFTAIIYCPIIRNQFVVDKRLGIVLLKVFEHFEKRRLEHKFTFSVLISFIWQQRFWIVFEFSRMRLKIYLIFIMTWEEAENIQDSQQPFTAKRGTFIQSTHSSKSRAQRRSRLKLTAFIVAHFLGIHWNYATACFYNFFRLFIFCVYQSPPYTWRTEVQTQYCFHVFDTKNCYDANLIKNFTILSRTYNKYLYICNNKFQLITIRIIPLWKHLDLPIVLMVGFFIVLYFL